MFVEEFAPTVDVVGLPRATSRLLAWDRLLAAQRADTIRFRELGEQGLALLSGTPRPRPIRWAELTDFSGPLERGMHALLARHRHETRARRASSAPTPMPPTMPAIFGAPRPRAPRGQ